MSNANETHAPDTRGDKSFVLMYPDNQLRDQVRSFEDTFSAFEVLREAFFSAK